MPLKELLPDGDVLDDDDPDGRIVLDHFIDEQRRKAIAEPVEQLGDVGGHASSGPSGSAPFTAQHGDRASGNLTVPERP